MFAILEAKRAGLLNAKNWLTNLTSGLIVGVVALPLSMAFAIASGVKPEQGLYTAIVAGIVVGIFGGSRVQIAGPTGAFIVILANITAQYGIIGLQIATLFAGFILICFGLIKLGSVIKFIPDPVIVGFTSGIGVIIFVGEWKDFFGLTLSSPLSGHFHAKLTALLMALPHFDLTTTGLALFSLLLVLFSSRFIKTIPSPLIAMVAATSLQIIFQFKSVATIGSMFGGIPQTLPTFHLPLITFSKATHLIGPAFTIALLGAIESLLSATAADGLAGTRHDSNQELIGQGLANILAPLFGGFAATGAIARTATNVRNGGNCPLSAIIHSIFLIAIIVIFAPLAVHIPLCTLAAILFVVAYNMSDIPHFIHIYKHAPSYDIIVLFTTFLLTIFTDLVVAVNVGVILSMLLFVHRMSQSVIIEQQDHTSNANEFQLPPGTVIYSIQGPFFFGVAEKFERAFAAIHEDPKNIIFRLHNVPFMDITGLQTFFEMIEALQKRGVNIYLCETNERLRTKLLQMDKTHLLSGGTIFVSLREAIMHCEAEQLQEVIV